MVSYPILLRACILFLFLIIVTSGENVQNIAALPGPQLTGDPNNKLLFLLAVPRIFRTSALQKILPFTTGLKFVPNYQVIDGQSLIFRSQPGLTLYLYEIIWYGLPILQYDATIMQPTVDSLFQDLYAIDNVHKVFEGVGHKLVVSVVDSIPFEMHGALSGIRISMIKSSLIRKNVSFIIFAHIEVYRHWLQLQYTLASKLFAVVPVSDDTTRDQMLSSFKIIQDKMKVHMLEPINHELRDAGISSISLSIYDDWFLKIQYKPQPVAIQYVVLLQEPYSPYQQKFFLDLLYGHAPLFWRDYIGSEFVHTESVLAKYSSKKYSLVKTFERFLKTFHQTNHPLLNDWFLKTPLTNDEPNHETLMKALRDPSLRRFMSRYFRKYADNRTVGVIVIPVAEVPTNLLNNKEDVEEFCYFSSLFDTRILFVTDSQKSYSDKITEKFKDFCVKSVAINDDITMINYHRWKSTIVKLIETDVASQTKRQAYPRSWNNFAYTPHTKGNFIFVFQETYNEFYEVATMFTKYIELIKERMTDSFAKDLDLEYLYSIMKPTISNESLIDMCAYSKLSDKTKPLLKKENAKSIETASVGLYNAIQCLSAYNSFFASEENINVIVAFVDKIKIPPGLTGLIQNAIKLQLNHNNNTHLIIAGPVGLMQENPILETGPWSIIETNNPINLVPKILHLIR